MMKLSSLFLLFLSLPSLAQISQEEMRQDLINRREAVKQWALTCENGSYSEKSGECYQWDVTLFSGLGCLAATLSGDTETAKLRCDDVKNAQADNGRWFRGPTKIHEEHENSFSRDMARGAHAYMIARALISQDPQEVEEVKLKALKWLEWISNEGQGKLCKEYTQNRCNITIGANSMFLNIYRSLGILPEPSGKILKSIHRSKHYVKNIFYLETKVSEKGFPRHLKASSLLFYRLLNRHPDGSVKDKKVEKIMSKTAKWLYEKDKKNLLLEFLHKGESPELITELLNRCPVQKTHKDIGKKHDFQWQRTYNPEMQNIADGHDCIYLMNLVLAKMDGKLNW